MHNKNKIRENIETVTQDFLAEYISVDDKTIEAMDIDDERDVVDFSNDKDEKDNLNG